MTSADIIPETSRNTKKITDIVWAHELDEDADPLWCVDRVIPEEGLVVIYGGPGTGKTHFVLNLLLSVGHGVEFCGHETSQGVSVLVAGEGLAGIRRRLTAWHQRHSLNVQDSNLLLQKGAIQLLNKDELRDLARQIKKKTSGKKIKMIVFDTLSRCLVKGDENLQSSMSEAVHNCSLIGEMFKCAIVLLHHVNKGGSNAPRGSTVLPGAADTMIGISRTTKGLDAVVEKQKEEESGQTLHFSLDPQTVGYDKAGKAITVPVAVFEGKEERSPVNDNRPKGKIQAALLDLIEPTGTDGIEAAALYQLALAKQLIGGAKPTRAFSTALEALESGEFVIRHGDLLFAQQ